MGYPIVATTDMSNVPNGKPTNIQNTNTVLSGTLGTFVLVGPDAGVLATNGHLVTGSWVSQVIPLEDTANVSIQVTTAVSGTQLWIQGTLELQVSNDPGLIQSYQPGGNKYTSSASLGAPVGGIYNWVTPPMFSTTISGSTSTYENYSGIGAKFGRLKWTHTAGSGSQIVSAFGKGTFR